MVAKFFFLGHHPSFPCHHPESVWGGYTPSSTSGGGRQPLTSLYETLSKAASLGS